MAAGVVAVAEEHQRQPPQALGDIGTECIGGDPEAAAARGARLDNRRYLAIREVPASDALKMRRSGNENACGRALLERLNS